MGRLLQDKAVIVTGAGRGLGRAYAVDAAAHGASVVVNDVRAENARATVQQIVSAGGRAISAPGPVNEAGAGRALVTAALEAFGRLDGLVANADAGASAGEIIGANLVGMVETGLPAMAHFTSVRAGSMILISSGARLHSGNSSAHRAGDEAVASLCWSWANESAQFGVRVNAISPIAGSVTADRDYRINDRPQDVAPAVTFFLSELAAHVTGQIFRFTDTRMGLDPSPSSLSAELAGAAWTADSIDGAMRGDYRVGVAPVGLAAADLSRGIRFGV
jgi:NAD(P)-dependent dehydrogenase (short-subunit alcohol dehydrogenase family)